MLILELLVSLLEVLVVWNVQIPLSDKESSMLKISMHTKQTKSKNCRFRFKEWLSIEYFI